MGQAPGPATSAVAHLTAHSTEKPTSTVQRFSWQGRGDATVWFYKMPPWSYTRVHARSQRKHGPVGVRDGYATELWFLGVCGFRRAGQRVESESKAITRCRVQAQEFMTTTILSDFCKFIELPVRAFFRNCTFFFEI